MDSRGRSLAKAFSYRLLGSASTGAMVFFFTGDMRTSIGAGLLDSVVKIVLYFLHERVWNSVPFGRPKAPEYEI